MIEPRGVVQKLVSDPFRTVHLKRCDVLLSECEWEWSADSDEAYVFETYLLAEAAAALLKAEGEEHVNAVVYGARSEAARRERAVRRETRERSADPDPQEERVRRYQEELERMHLA